MITLVQNIEGGRLLGHFYLKSPIRLPDKSRSFLYPNLSSIWKIFCRYIYLYIYIYVKVNLVFIFSYLGTLFFGTHWLDKL